ncbi:GIY-YIG nuclease family protein [uncultured Flavobacterium sp.]|uniref:GIY-YIG nuclease family protein n=1 Tax=uncultured Flavobacterium sp. TaxID=165435 RepID=UPI002595D769|nr:GIY-YIG nuclease family protein [uncultured Flavobacterium sp.]
MIIYKATNITNGKVYIGQTARSLARRKIEHINQARNNSRSCKYFHAALIKYGFENFTWDVLFTTDDLQILNTKEVEFIQEYNSFGDNGYNLCIGGNSNTGYKHSFETIAKMKQRRHTESSKDKLRLAHSGKVLSEITKNKIRQINLGKKANSDTKLKMSISQKNKGTKHVLCIELNEVFSSLTAAAEKLNLSISHISRVCNGKRQSTGGYSFKFVDKND